MVFVTKKKKNGRIYYYLEKRAWINGKSQRLWQKYLGPENKVQEWDLSLGAKNVEYKFMSFGASAALHHVAQKIGFIEIIDKVAGKSRDQNLSLGEYMLINTVNRCIKPGSKNKLAEWFEDDYLATIYPIDSKILNAQTYWNHFQLLDEEKIANIESELIRKVMELYKLDLSTVLFDPTNFYTFISEHDDKQLAKFGHSKENRNNLRIVNVSILCTFLHGVPLYHYTYEGNIQDAKHFKRVISQIKKRFKTFGQEITDITLIFDKGNHSSEAFTDIDSLKLPFIASLRNSTQKDLLTIPKAEFTFINLQSNDKEVGYYRIERKIYDKDRYVYVLLDSRKKRKDSISFEEKLELRLSNIDEWLKKLNIKKWRDKAAVEKKLKSLIGKRPFSTVISASVTGAYGELKVTIDIDEKAKEEYLETLGRSMIFTNINKRSPEIIIQAFRDKYIVEDSFKQLKNTKFLSIRPMYHWTDNSIRAHVFSCTLGLLLLSLVRLELRQKKIYLSFEEILANLSKIGVTKIYVSSKRPPFYKLNKIDPIPAEIYKKLKLKAFLPK